MPLSVERLIASSVACADSFYVVFATGKSGNGAYCREHRLTERPDPRLLGVPIQIAIDGVANEIRLRPRRGLCSLGELSVLIFVEVDLCALHDV